MWEKEVNLWQEVSGVGMWARSDDREARWSQLVRASTQPDSAPSIDSNSSSSCWSWTWWPWLKIIQKPILQSSTKNRRRRRIDGLITCGAEEEDEPVSWFAIQRERETVVLTFSNRVEAEPSGKTTTLRSLGFCELKSMKNYNLPPHLGLCMVRRFFDPTHYGGSKKFNTTQPII